ncbi:MAG: hypothetical protein ACFFER_15880 [Candidatus Thorarchaeota archaeon]
MSKFKQPYNPNNRIFWAIVLLSLILLILIILTINPSAGEGFINILDATQTAAVILSICFILVLGFILIYDDRRKGYKKIG